MRPLVILQGAHVVICKAGDGEGLRVREMLMKPSLRVHKPPRSLLRQRCHQSCPRPLQGSERDAKLLQRCASNATSPSDDTCHHDGDRKMRLQERKG